MDRRSIEKIIIFKIRFFLSFLDAHSGFNLNILITLYLYEDNIRITYTTQVISTRLNLKKRIKKCVTVGILHFIIFN